MLLLSPSPISLLGALLLCLPLALIFTITTTPTTTTTNGGATSSPCIITTTGGASPFQTTLTSTTTNTSVKKTTSNPVLTAIKSTIKTRRRRPTNNNTTIAPPPSTAEIFVDDEDDNALFRLAARANPNPTSPRKIAFLFLTTTPLPFAPIWEIYFRKTPKTLYNVYVHADPSYRYDPPFSGVFENRVIPGSKPTRRHSPTLISAARRLLSHALTHDRSNFKFALLSPSCIPLHSFRFTYKTLARSRKSFVEILRNESGAWERWAARGEEAMLPEVPFDEFRIGSQFFVLTRRHARVVVADRRLWAKFNAPCAEPYTCYPEEQYFATLLNRKDPRGCVPATLTHVDWAGRDDGHPRTYNATEVGPDLIVRLRRGRPRYGDEEKEEDAINGSDASVRKRRHPFLFARKFSPDSVEPLLSMASGVIYRD